MRRWAQVLVAVAALTALAGCTSASPAPTTTDQATTGETKSGQTPTGETMVDLGGGREMYLTCQGTGSPTVVLISGTGGAADEWTELPGDGTLRPVFDAVAESTRVCTYDRPGTTRADGELSPTTPVPQPTDAQQGVDDLATLLEAADEPGPYLLVGASWGGLIAQLFARRHPESTAGLVLVDAASAHLQESLTPEQWQAWMATIASARSDSGAENPAYEPSLQELADAGPPPQVPAAVLSSDQPWDLQVTPGASTWPAWLEAQSALAAELGAEHLSETHSGHGIQVEQPELVSDTIRRILDEARRN